MQRKKQKNYITKVNDTYMDTYMIRLDRTIATSTSHFSHILSKNSFQILLNNMYK